MNRSFAAGVLALALLPGLAACGAGFEAETQHVKGDNASGELNGILARAIVVVKGKQSPTGAIAGTLINRSDKSDMLTTISLTDHTPGAATVTLSPNLPLDPGQLVPLGVGEFKPIAIPDARALKVGNFVDLVLTFREAGQMKLQVATEDRTFYFSDVIPEGDAPPAKPTATPKPTTTAKATPAAKQTPAAEEEAE